MTTWHTRGARLGGQGVLQCPAADHQHKTENKVHVMVNNRRCPRPCHYLTTWHTHGARLGGQGVLQCPAADHRHKTENKVHVMVIDDAPDLKT